MTKSNKKYNYYPNIDDNEFNEDIYHKKEFYITRSRYPDKNLTIDDICAVQKNYGDEYILQSHQRFVSNYINPNTPYQRLLLFWGTGVGKTCGAISIAEGFIPSIMKYHEQGMTDSRIYILSSEASKNNFQKELLGACPREQYITKEEKNKLEELKRKTDATSKDMYDSFKKELLNRLENPKYGGYYYFIGYQKFTNRTIGARLKDARGRTLHNKDGTIKRKPRTGKLINSLDNSVLLVDEAHMLNQNDWGEAVYHMIQKSKNLRVILMTATPMSNNPREIVKLLNILLPIEQRIDKNDLFKDKYTLKPNAFKIISEKSKGFVSYIRGVNPISFPKRVDMGEIIHPIDVSNDENFKYTYLIRCEMSKLHYDTYKVYYTGSKNQDMKRLVDMVLPNPNDNETGLFRTSDINEYKNVAKSWLEKNKIEILLNKNRVIVSGNIFLFDNIEKYSSKYHKVLQNIFNSLNPNSGPIFIYNENIQGIGLSMFEEILKINGIGKYKETDTTITDIRCVLCGTYKSKHKNKDHQYKPAIFIILEGETDITTRNTLVEKFNSRSNINGEEIKILLGSSITKESIDFKAIREIHILNFQWNISTIEQIIGRGVRHCSHYLLSKDKQNVKIFKYVSSLPNNKDGTYEISAEENAYLKAERTHIVIKKIERILKENAVDCALSKYNNVFIDEIKRYHDCEKTHTCNLLCDYTTCNYKCKYEPKIAKKDNYLNKYAMLELKDLDTNTYDVYFANDEIELIKGIIKELFQKDIIWTMEDIIEQVHEISKKKEFDYIQNKYIYIALDDLIENKDEILNSYKDVGYIIYRGIYYLFQPTNKDQDILLDERRVPSEITRQQMINLSDYITMNAKYMEKPQFDLTLFMNKIKSETNKGKIARIINKLDYEQQINVLELVITGINKKETKLSNYNNKILSHFNTILITKDQLETTEYIPSLYDNDASSNPDKIIVGHYLKELPRCYKNDIWKTCDLKITRKQIDEYKENNIIIGYTEKYKNGKVIFKIKEPDQNANIMDKRKKKRGFVCKEMSNKKMLVDIVSKLNIGKQLLAKNSITDLCKLIELELRKRQRDAIRKGQKIRWMYNYWELPL